MFNPLYSTMPINSDVGHLGQSLDPNKAVFHRSNEFNSVGHSNFIDPFPMKITEVQRSTMHTSLNLKEGYLMGQQKTQGSYISSSVDSLEDLVSSAVKEIHKHYIKRASCVANWQKQWLKLLLLLLCIFGLFLLVLSLFYEHFGVPELLRTGIFFGSSCVRRLFAQHDDDH